MGTHHGGDSGNPPPDGDHSPDDPPGLPELPAEWGEIVIPDDASALAAEAEQVRRELAERREGVFGFRGLESRTGSGEREPSVGVPLLIMSVAVLITLVSLFAMAWSGTGDPDVTDPAQTYPESAEVLRGLALVDAAGQPVAPTAYAPVAMLLVEECHDCLDLVAATAAAAPAGVSVAAVGHAVPVWPPGTEPQAGTAPLLFADPDETVRAALGLAPPTDVATVVLLDRDGRVAHTVPTATSVEQFRTQLERLA